MQKWRIILKIPQGLLEKLILPQKKILIFPPGNQLIFLHIKRYSDSETLKKCAQLFNIHFTLLRFWDLSWLDSLYILLPLPPRSHWDHQGRRLMVVMRHLSHPRRINRREKLALAQNGRTKSRKGSYVSIILLAKFHANKKARTWQNRPWSQACNF